MQSAIIDLAQLARLPRLRLFQHAFERHNLVETKPGCTQFRIRLIEIQRANRRRHRRLNRVARLFAVAQFGIDWIAVLRHFERASQLGPVCISENKQVNPAVIGGQVRPITRHRKLAAAFFLRPPKQLRLKLHPGQIACGKVQPGLIKSDFNAAFGR